MAREIELERMIGASPAPAAHPGVGRLDGRRAAMHRASLADVVLRHDLAAVLYTAAEALEAAS